MTKSSLSSNYHQYYTNLKAAYYTQHYRISHSKLDELELVGRWCGHYRPVCCPTERRDRHIESMETTLTTNHRLTVIMVLPCTYHSGSIEVFW